MLFFSFLNFILLLTSGQLGQEDDQPLANAWNFDDINLIFNLLSE